MSEFKCPHCNEEIDPQLYAKAFSQMGVAARDTSSEAMSKLAKEGWKKRKK